MYTILPFLPGVGYCILVSTLEESGVGRFRVVKVVLFEDWVTDSSLIGFFDRISLVSDGKVRVEGSKSDTGPEYGTSKGSSPWK